MYANEGVNMLIKHKTKSFSPICKTKYICININTTPLLRIKEGKHAYIPNTSPPFCQSSIKGSK